MQQVSTPFSKPAPAGAASKGAPEERGRGGSVTHAAKARASPSPKISAGMALCSACLLFVLGLGITELARTNYITGVVSLLAALSALYYIGRGLTPVPQVETDAAVERQESPPTIPSRVEEEQPATTLIVVPSPVPVLPARRSGPAVETVRPVMVVPAEKSVLEPRWLVIRRADGFEWSHPVPYIPSNHGWYFAWGDFYVRRDFRGCYACLGHPDDRLQQDAIWRLFEGVATKIGEYTLTIVVDVPHPLN